mgnify:CR=1 FL=1
MSANSKQVKVKISERIDNQLSIFSDNYGISKTDIIERSVLSFINAINN